MDMRSFLIVLCFTLPNFGVTIGAAADWSSIKIGTDGTFPPWSATNSGGEIIGFEIDLAEDLCRRMEADCTLVAQDWRGMIPALTTGRYDAIMAGMPITEERREKIAFTRCYANEPANFLVKSDSALAQTPPHTAKVNLDTLEPEDRVALQGLREAFAGIAIGVQVATAHEDFVAQYLSDVAELQQFETVEALIQGLEAGRIDTALLSKGSWQALQESDRRGTFLLFGPDLAGDRLGQGVGVGIRKEDSVLRTMIDSAIAEAIADGTISQLSTRWFGYDLSC